MKKRFSKLSALLLLGLLLIGMSLVCCMWVRKEQRQYKLNRDLIAALLKNDTRQALVLVEAGADPNTSVEPTLAPSLRSLVKQLLHHTPVKANSSLTAFVLASGCEFFYPKGSNTAVIYFVHHPDPYLTHVMLVHGANVNVKDSKGTTALHVAIIRALSEWSTEYKKNKEIIKLLLAYGADPDEEDKAFRGAYGTSPLKSVLAAEAAGDHSHPELIALLRKYQKHP